MFEGIHVINSLYAVSPSRVIDMRNRHKEAFLNKHSVKLGFMSPFVKAACYALQDQPVVNAGKCSHTLCLTSPITINGGVCGECY